MGLFSFLSGKKEDAAETPSTPAAPASATSAAPASTATATVEPPLPEPSSFVPPESWNVDAFTAPPPPPAGDAPKVGPADPGKIAELQGPIVEVLKTVYDPEIPVDIYELGLIYDIVVDAQSYVLVKMTLTSPACPSAQQLPSEVRYKVKAVPGVTDAWVEIVWEPPWTKDLMSESAKLALGIF